MTKKTMRVGAIGAAALLGTSLLTPAFAGSAGACDACALEARVATLEAQMAQAKRGGVDVPSDLTLKFGGYVKADFIYDINHAGTENQGGGLGGGIFAYEENGGFQAHARQTRFNFTATKDTALGPIKAFFEIDFFGSNGNQALSNSHNPRMRHAFVEWNGWLAGQTWTLFMPLAESPGTVDFGGPAGTPFLRQAGLRYTGKAGNLTYSLAIENPEQIGDGSTVNNNERYPDVLAAIRWAQGGYSFRVAGVVRDVKDRSGAGNTGSETGYGINVGASAGLWEGGKWMGNISWGKGIGRYIIDGTTVGPDFVGGSAVKIEQWGFATGLSQQLTPVLRGQVAYGYHKVEDDVGQAGGAAPDGIEKIQTLFVSLFWTPVERYTVMAEASWVETQTFLPGSDRENLRLQTAVQFNF